MNLKAIGISEGFRANFAHEIVEFEVELDVSFQTHRSFALLPANVAQTVTDMVEFYVEILFSNFREGDVADVTLVVKLVRSFVLLFRWVRDQSSFVGSMDVTFVHNHLLDWIQ